MVSAWNRHRNRSTPQPVSSAEDLEQAAGKLASLVAEQWREETKARSLDDPAPMPVWWKRTRWAELMGHPANRTPRVPNRISSDDVPGLVKHFRGLNRRRLVILGGPGSGKTTLAMQLLCGLLETRQEGEPVPVLLSVADWDVDRHPSLAEWVAAVLDRDYPALRAPDMPPDAVSRLAGLGRILPVLDGLDEVPVLARTKVLEALNRSLADSDQVILTCRTDEFPRTVAAAGGALTSAEVLEAEPLSPWDAADYLQHCLPPHRLPAWEPVLTRIRASSQGRSESGRALAEVVATPLGLWLLRTVYIKRNSDPALLLEEHRFPTPDALRDHLFDHLIDALIDTRPPIDAPEKNTGPFRPHRRHGPAQVRTRLGYLACLLSGQGTRDLAWWRLATAIPAFPAIFRRAVGLAFGLIGGLAGGLLAGLVGTLMDGLAVGLVIGLTGMLTGGLWAKKDADLAVQPLPRYADLRLRHRRKELIRRLTVGIALGLTAGLAFWPVIGLAAGLADGLADGLAFGLVTGLVMGLVVGLPVGLTVGHVIGLIKWAETPASTNHATTPMASWKADRNLNLLRLDATMLAIVLAGVLASGLVGMLAGVLAGRLAAVLASGMAGVLARRLLLSGDRAWLVYLVASWWLAWKKLLPRNLMPFLDDCHRLGLLRAVGPIYQFRHAEFQDYLAADYRRAHGAAGGREIGEKAASEAARQ